MVGRAQNVDFLVQCWSISTEPRLTLGPWWKTAFRGPCKAGCGRSWLLIMLPRAGAGPGGGTWHLSLYGEAVTMTLKVAGGKRLEPDQFKRETLVWGKLE